jgi:hypothetical protein
MQAVILLSTLAMGLAMASSSFGQSVNMVPSRAYDAQGYVDEAPVARWSDDVVALIAVLAVAPDQDAQAHAERTRRYPLIPQSRRAEFAAQERSTSPALPESAWQGSP